MQRRAPRRAGPQTGQPRQVLDQMFAGVPTDGRFGGGSAEGVYRDLLNQEYAKVLSRSGGLGVADAVYREILKLQEVE